MRHDTRHGERGTTLLEAMMATVVLMVGFMGVMATDKIGAWMNGTARSVTRATAIAQDLSEQIGLWSYTDPRLSDGIHNLVALDQPEPELTKGGTLPWNGIPTAVVRDGVPYSRTWTVERTDDIDGDGVKDGAKITINVASTNGVDTDVDKSRAATSSVTLYTYKINPVVNQGTP